VNVSVRIYRSQDRHIALVTDLEGGGDRFESDDILDLIDTVHGWMEGRIKQAPERV
jgi:hypothetical protein